MRCFATTKSNRSPAQSQRRIWNAVEARWTRPADWLREFSIAQVTGFGGNNAFKDARIPPAAPEHRTVGRWGVQPTPAEDRLRRRLRNCCQNNESASRYGCVVRLHRGFFLKDPHPALRAGLSQYRERPIKSA